MRPARLISYRRRFMAGAGLGHHSSAQGPLVTWLITPGGWPWLPDGPCESPSVPRLRPRARWVLDPRRFPGCPRLLGPGQGGLLWMWHAIPNFERNRSFILSYAAGERGANGTRVARRRFNGQFSWVIWR